MTRRWAIAGIVVCCLAWVARAETPVKPPIAKRVEHFNTWHGEQVADEYHWLREKSNPEVIEYLEAENAYANAMTKDLKEFEEVLYDEMLGRIKQTDLSVPTVRGGYYYYSRTDEGKQYPVQCRRKGSMDAPEEVLLDLNELAEGHSYLGLGAFTVSDDERMLAYTTDTTGFRQYTLTVKDLQTGETLADTAERVTSVQWAADNKTLFLTTEDPVTKRSDHLWRHTLGDNHLEPLYEERDELFRIHAERTRDKKFVLLTVVSSDTTEVRYVSADDPQADFRVFLPREKHHRYYVGHREGQFYIRTNKNAQNFQIVTAPEADPRPENWKEFVPHREDVLLLGIDLFKNFAVVVEKSQAINSMRILDFANGDWNEITFPEPVYSAYPYSNPEYDTRAYRYNYQSLVTPSTVYDYNTETHESTLLKQQEVLGGYDPEEYVSERLWATMRDGTRVPLSIVYKKGVPRDGSAPLFLYGYGSYGAGLSASFAEDRLCLLDRGMIFCMAHIRGGNELGEEWRAAGMLMRKKNTFNDFVDSAEFLVKEKWTSPQRLVAQGYSAGGLLMGAVVNMRPDLFRAIHCAVPFVDVMNTMMDPSLPLTTSEYLVWGNPHEKPAYDYMMSYSPYDNLKPAAYPAMLVTGSLNDSQVMYWEPAKYVARMRRLKTNDSQLLLKTNMGAGHGGASGRYDHLREQAFEYAWLMTQVGITN
jgi:oligopeptidase B